MKEDKRDLLSKKQFNNHHQFISNDSKPKQTV